MFLRRLCLVMAVSVVATAGPMTRAAAPQQAPPAAWEGTLFGTIQSAGRPIEGVVVSARAESRPITTSVFTDARGRYYFPALEKGRYRVWAQAVGFETARTAVDLAALVGEGIVAQHFSLKPLKDFTRQLSGPEFMNALPEDTFERRRMKAIFRNNCAGCHQPNFVLQNRFDEAGWLTVIDVMARIGIYGTPPRPDAAPLPLIDAFKDDLAKYLAEMRGPGPSPMTFTPLPRPTGESARVVITEYDVTANANPSAYVTQDGSDWLEGVPSAYEARGPHDAEVDSRGFVWIVDSQDNRARTISKLDPRTGVIKDFKLEQRPPTEWAMGSHGIVIDANDIAWFNADGGLGKVDTRTEKIDWFEPPASMARVDGTLDVDPKGMVWTTTDEGALRFDPRTNTFQEFTSLNSNRQCRTYGIAADIDGNAWWAQMGCDMLAKSDINGGTSLEVKMQRRPGLEALATPRDKELYERVGSQWNSSVVWTQGPRRLGADRKAPYVYVANWWGDNLAKIDIRTNKTTYYQYPLPGFAGVYDATVDRNGKVWVNLMNGDRVARFDPTTERWTEYQLPSRGAETRFIAVDNHKPTVEVWTPYWRTNRIARLQFRTQDQLQAAELRTERLRATRR
jgi:streptogramin lyase